MRRSYFLLSTLICTAACGQSADELGLGALQQPVVNGEPSVAADDSTVYVMTRLSADEGIACTGTMIAPNLVATALHCVTQSILGQFSCKPDGSLTDSTQADGQMGPLVDAESVEIHAGVQVSSEPSAVGARLLGTSSNQICRGDIAFVVLDRALDLPIAPVRLDYGVQASERLRVVGYGQTEASGSSGRYARSDVRVIDIGPDSEDEPSISASPRTFVVSEGPCHGDSGGPAFSQETEALLGVYSLTAGASCTGVGIRNVYTSLSSYSRLALQAFDAAGAVPVLDEAEPEPTTPGVLPASGCSLSAPHTGSPEAASLLALAALGLGLVFRRRG